MSSLAAPAPAAPAHLARGGARAGLWGGAALAAWVMFCGEVAAQPTAVAGVASSTWTGVTAITGLVFGADAVHGSFHVLSIAFGLAALLALGVVLGVACAAAVDAMLGPQPAPAGAAIVAVAVALTAQVLLVDLLVNGAQSPDVLYHAIPPWGWWVGSIVFGVVAGLRLARAGARR